MLKLFEQLGVLVFVAAIGFTGKKLGFISGAVEDALCAIAVKLALPFMMFSVAAGTAAREDFIAGLPILLFALCAVLFILCAAFGLATLLGLREKLRLLFTSMMLCDNAGFIGIPLVSSLFAGDSGALLAPVMYFTVDITFVWSIGYYFMTGGPSGGRFEPRRLVSPVTAGLFLGLVWMFAGLPTDFFLLDAAAGLGDCAKYLAMLYLGCAMTSLKPKAALTSPLIYAQTLVKQLIIPVICLLAASALRIMDAGQRTAFAVMAGLPMMSSAPMITHECRNHEDFTLQATLFTTAVFPLTVTAVVWLAEVLP
jgi:predicted permease